MSKENKSAGTDDKAQKPAKPAAQKELTAAGAAKLVKRRIESEDKNGKKTVKHLAIKADEVLDFKDYGDHVMVVTIDGQKFRGEKS